MQPPRSRRSRHSSPQLTPSKLANPSIHPPFTARPRTQTLQQDRLHFADHRLRARELPSLFLTYDRGRSSKLILFIIDFLESENIETGKDMTLPTTPTRGPQDPAPST